MKDEKLKEIDEEDIIFCIFIGLFIIKMWSNKVERDYRINNDEYCRRKYHHINEFTFFVAFIIAIYSIYCCCKGEKISYLALIANVLSIVTLGIFIYLEIVCDD